MNILKEVPSFTDDFYELEHEEFRLKARKFIEGKILPFVEEWEKARMYPTHRILTEMAQEGLLGANFPVEYGGQGKDIRYHIVLVEELAKVPSAGVSMSILVHQDMVAPMLVDYGDHEVCKKFLQPALSGVMLFGHAVSEEKAGSDVGNIQTFVRREGDGYILNGLKKYVTNGFQADVYCVLAKIEHSIPPVNMVLLMVPKTLEGVRTSGPIEKMGHHSCDTVDVYFENVHIPNDCRIGGEGLGFVYQLQQFEKERIISACRATEMADFYLNETIKRCKKRNAFSKKLIEHQSISFRLAELKTEVELSRQLNYGAVRAWLSGSDYRTLSAMSKLKSSKLVRKTSDECLQLFGAEGYLDDHFISRFYRDSRLFSISTGSDEMMLNIISKLEKISDSPKKGG
jgi:citronellyl-CoA dehydrogenase